MHESLDEFEIRPDMTTDITCRLSGERLLSFGLLVYPGKIVSFWRRAFPVGDFLNKQYFDHCFQLGVVRPV